MKFQQLLAMSVGSIALALAWPEVHAALINPVSAQATSTFFTYDANNLINNSGLSDQGHDTNPNSMWLSGSSSTATLTFDLGENFSLSGAYFWQYYVPNIGSSRSVKGITISTSLNGLSFSPVLSTQLSEAGNTSFIGGQFKAFDQVARFVQVDIHSNYGSNSYFGLGEVKFEGELRQSSPSVPEPSLLALLAMGILACWFWLVWDSMLNILVFDGKQLNPVRLYRRNSYSPLPPDVTSQYRQLDKFIKKDQSHRSS